MGDFCLEEKLKANPHSMRIRERKAGNISGVKDVVAFDEGEICLITNQGVLTIKGGELHVTRLDLDKQEVDIAGQIDSLIYSQGAISKAKGGDGILKRLFR